MIVSLSKSFSQSIFWLIHLFKGNPVSSSILS
ncbi:hypothetical protein BSTP3_058 [Bacillus phage BSTP3]|nr:hypothetical protein BSTP3_058 [Bacillus phage BSTP3]